MSVCGCVCTHNHEGQERHVLYVCVCDACFCGYVHVCVCVCMFACFVCVRKYRVVRYGQTRIRAKCMLHMCMCYVCARAHPAAAAARRRHQACTREVGKLTCNCDVRARVTCNCDVWDHVNLCYICTCVYVYVREVGKLTSRLNVCYICISVHVCMCVCVCARGGQTYIQARELQTES